MKKYRIQILEYYENVKNDVDIHFERLLMSSALHDEQKTSINSSRNKIIEEINKIQTINLENYQREFPSDSESIFIGKFCFFIPRTNFEKDPFIFKNHPFGVLVMTNQHICSNVIEYLNVDLNREEYVNEHNMSESKEVILFNVLKCLIITKSKRSSDIIDLSVTKKNQLKEFKIERSKALTFSEDDFKLIGTMVSTETWMRNFFNFDSVLKIQRGLFSELNWMKNLYLECNSLTILEPRCFERLKSLTSLDICSIRNKNIDKTYLIGLENLKRLVISDSYVKIIQDNTFECMKSLIELALDSNNIDQLTDSTFNGLDELRVLELNWNEIKSISENAFLKLKNLAFLNLHDCLRGKRIDLTCLNHLENLFVLALDQRQKTNMNLQVLDLPSLRYLAISSRKVPKFKNVENLIYLKITRLKKISHNSFIHLEHLKGLKIETVSKCLKNINSKNFGCLKNLKSLTVGFDSLKNEEIERIKIKEEYYKNFLESTHNANFETNFTDYEKYFEVSNYDGIKDFFRNEMDLNDEFVEDINEHHECFN